MVEALGSRIEGWNQATARLQAWVFEPLEYRADETGLHVTLPPPPDTAAPRYATVLRITDAQ